MSAPEDHPTPLADRVRSIAAGLIADCRLAADYEAKLLDVADEIAVFERREVSQSESQTDSDPKFAKLDTYLNTWGLTRDGFLSDTRRPLVFKIGTTEYILREEAAFFEAQVKAAAHYARAGIPEHRAPGGPVFRPELLLEDEDEPDAR